jgi:serine/threonine-protein kinase
VAQAEDAETLVQGHKPARASVPAPTPTAATFTPERALEADEAGRSRLFLQLCGVMAGAVAVCIPFTSGSPALHVAVAVACAAALVVVFVFRRVLHDDVVATPGKWLVVAGTLVVASCVGVYFFGVFSPAPMVGTFGIYFLCLGRSMKVAFLAYVSGALAHAVPSLLIAAGVLHDPGLITTQAPARDLLVTAFMVQVVFACTFALARGSRGATRRAVEQLHAALVQVQKREALLAEARLDLDRALLAGRRGPYSATRLGDFVLGQVVGRGAMGDVYEARHASTGERAAVKVLHGHLAADGAHVERFLREAQIIARLKSPHVVRFLGTSAGVSAPPHIAMELLDGKDLAWHLRRETRLSPARVVELVDHVADALEDAAQAGVVHRDLKPQNLVLAKEGGWKVLDFGVSKLLDETFGALTQGAPVGTPGYMAPEQARGAEIDAAADVFALACIAYRSLCGQPPFAGDDLPKILFDTCYAQPARPSSLVALPRDVDRVLALGLAKRVEDRFARAKDLAGALRTAVEARLAPDLRARADAVLARLPWGTRPA